MHHPPLIILEDKLEEINKIRSALDILDIPNPQYYFTRSDEMRAFLNETYASANPSLLFRPAFFLFDFQIEESSITDRLKWLKSHPLFCSVPAIVFSDTREQERIDSCYAHGCSGYFLKPSNAEGYTRILETIYQFWKTLEQNAAAESKRGSYLKMP